MERFFIEGIDTIPEIDFNPNGMLKMSGKAIPEDSKELFDPALKWVKSLETDKVVFDINLIYFNTAVSKQIYEVLFALQENTKVNNVLVKWHYEEGDEDNLETGEMFEEELPGLRFEYFEYAEAVC